MFRFKQFSICDDNSTMKVGTDALLLSAMAPLPEKGEILDIGTGCGVVALLLAQVSKCNIDAIDIDEPSIIEAATNFANSPWADKISAIHKSLQEYSFVCKKKYDLVISNPPFFEKSLKGENSRRNLARHNDTLNLQDLFLGVRFLMSVEGAFCVILPSGLLKNATSIASLNGFHLNRIIEVVTRQGKPSTRSVMIFSYTDSSVISDKLTVNVEDDQFTIEYRDLMKSFLTIF